ncbi:F-box only protein [Schistosoma japonicum]|uniref:F-box only protein n=2 Tax=Schistosoma japonicum TaxID=6182 RepID=A0A4Z2D206_SCHJA|nr:F-box only protein 36 [Schistosoma japonicum]TNN10514.1 F-box only protein [Schistosoma japonicum]
MKNDKIQVFKNPLFLHYKVIDPENVAQFAVVAPAPSKDFYHLLVTATEFKLRWWKITSRNDGAKFHPGESIATYEEFRHDDRMQSEIFRVMGQTTLDYCLNICAGNLDYLVRMPNEILEKVIFYLNLEDVINLGATSKHLNQICNSNSLWREIYVNTTLTHPSKSIEDLAKIFGWKKLLFTSKLHLQMQLRRLTLEESGDNESVHFSIPHDPELYQDELKHDEKKPVYQNT